jgi:hypothetical protein
MPCSILPEHLAAIVLGKAGINGQAVKTSKYAIIVTKIKATATMMINTLLNLPPVFN